jgi:alpha-mannosidase
LINDLIVRSHGSRVTTAVDEDGPLRTVFRAEREFDLPRRVDRKTCWRSDDRAPMRVTDWCAVDKGSPVVRVHTRIENACEDHRFRVLFPTEIATDQSFAETPFAIVARDIRIPPESATWHERVNPETAFTTFFGLQGQEGGLAVLAPFGLHEYEVTQTPERALALTLFRATGTTVGTSGEPDGQLLGTLEFDYMLYPFQGQFDAVTAMRLVAEAQTSVRGHAADKAPGERSFLRLEKGAAVMTAIKPAADGTGGVVRLWNPTDTDVEDRVLVTAKVVSAQACNLNEEPGDAIRLDNSGAIPVTVPAGGLATIRFTWEE